MWLVALLFLLSLPIGLFFDIATSIENLLGGEEPQTKVLYLLPIVFLNFVLVHLILVYRAKKAIRDSEQDKV
jgi:hypothetical protein